MAAWGCVLRVGLRPGRRGEGVAHMASGITQPQMSRLRRELVVLGSWRNASSGTGEKAETWWGLHPAPSLCTREAAWRSWHLLAPWS